MGSVGCLKTEILATFKLHSQIWLNTSGQAGCQIVISLFSKSALYSSSLLFWRYNQFCFSHLETFVSGAFSEFLNIVKISQKFIERTIMETLQLVLLV